ncbi:DUF4340 domain-containing protein [Paludicola sp. MB14-C6]|uniref:DUF4340 domain-containing protein n=1 Tax=Paludihabitans sp. MB14-C6 TaxID=3070656 RepID=UPI0027DC1E21|nr:DUF4340 domain-containing protein [Paludicola sp. MB14-C6]WMJ22135.1 DUF4340 domain-containing protein [Paludicola sp. MB14-C6]
MSNKIKAIIAGGCVLLLLVAVLVVLVLTKKPAKEENPNSQEKNYITLVKETVDSIESLKIKNEKDEYTISKQGENKWGIKEIMEYPQAYHLYLETLGQAQSVTALEVIEKDATDLSKYGLLNPKLTFEVKPKNKPVIVIHVGEKSSDKKATYIRVGDQKTVYVASTDAFTNLYYDRYAYIDKVLIPGLESDEVKDIPKIDKMSVTRPDLEKPIVLEKFAEGELSANAATQASIKMTSPVHALISETPAQDLVYGNFGIIAESILKGNPTKEDLVKYGFDKPTSVFELKYNGTSSVKITTGKGIECKHEEGEDLTGHTHQIVSYYAMREGINQIYIVKASDLRWMKMQPKDILSTVAVLPHILDTQSIDVTLNNKKNTIAFQLNKDKPKDVNEITATLNGSKADINNAKAYFQCLQLTAIQDINKVQPNKAAAATVQYNYRNGKKDVVEIYVLDDRTCIISLNGNNAFVGRAGYVDKLVKELANLEAGKTVDTDW